MFLVKKRGCAKKKIKAIISIEMINKNMIFKIFFNSNVYFKLSVVLEKAQPSQLFFFEKKALTPL
jgi:hypothetical protein